MKKLISIILVLVLVLGSFADAFAATKKSDNIVRLSKTEGSVTIKDSSGVKKTISENGKLLTGYTVATGKNGYAYITQGEKKLIKLDINTTISIKQGKNKRKIEVFLESGTIFVNVSSKLGKDEKLDIKTTNTTTGVRGTMLELSVITNENTSSLGNTQASLGGIVKTSAPKADLKESANGNIGGVSNLSEEATIINVVEGMVETKVLVPSDSSLSSKPVEKIVQLTVGQTVNVKTSVNKEDNSTVQQIEQTTFTASDLRGSTLSEFKNIDQTRLEGLAEKVGKDTLTKEINTAEEKKQTEQKEAEKQGTNPSVKVEEKKSEENNTHSGGSGSGDTPNVPPVATTYSVTLVMGNGTLAPGQLTPTAWQNNAKSNLTNGSVVTLPGNASVNAPNGYNFKGWFDNADGTGSAITSVTISGADQTVYAIYEAKTYKVTLDLKGAKNLTGASLADQTGWTNNEKSGLTKDTVVQLPDVNAPTGYDFTGWTAGAGTTTIAAVTIADKDVTVQAVYEAKKYTINLVLNSGSIADAITNGWESTPAGYSKKLAYDSVLPSPQAPNATEIFAGWYEDQNFGGNAVTKVGTSDKTYYAKYVAKPVGQTITLHLDGGTFTTLPEGWAYNDDNTCITKTVSPGAVTSLNGITPTITNGNFTGWQDALNATYTSIQTPQQADQIVDVDLYAKYSGQGTITLYPSTGYKISMVVDGLDSRWKVVKVTGSTTEIEKLTYTYQYGEAVSLPVDAIYFVSTDATNNKTYTASGWYSNPECTGNAISSVTAMTAGDITCYAQMTEGHLVYFQIQLPAVTADVSWSVTMDEIPNLLTTYNRDYNVYSLQKMFVHGGELSLPTPKLLNNGVESTGYTFSGWSYYSDKKTKIDLDRDYPLTGSFTVSAASA